MLTISKAKLAKTNLEKEIAQLLKEFGERCQCEVNMIHIRATAWGADEQRPLAYHVEVDAKL